MPTIATAEQRPRSLRGKLHSRAASCADDRLGRCDRPDLLSAPVIKAGPNPWTLGERWLFRHRTPARLVLLAGAITAALHFEEGLPGMLVALRAAAVIAVIARLAGRGGMRPCPHLLPRKATVVASISG
jgi:hypothetical protein